MNKLSRYQQIAQQLRTAIEAGVLPEGARVPSVRRLGREHGVSELTALQALRVLEQERLVDARPRSGFYVARRRGLAVPAPMELAPVDEQTRTHLSIMGSPCRVRLDLANGEPGLYPTGKLSVLMRQLVYRDPGLLGAPLRGTGYPALKEQIVRRAFDYGCTLHPDEVVVTHGCVESLSLALRTVARPGDGVAVESPTYFVILRMLRSLGLHPVEISTGEEGMDLDALEAVLRSGKVTAVLSIANANNPTGVTLPVEHKRALVALAQRHGAVVIEDDIYGDTHFSGERPLPLRAFSEEVILCSSFSKTLAPGIRVGWVAAGRWSSQIAAEKYSSTMGTGLYAQAAIVEFLRSGGYDLHLRRLRQTLHKQVGSMRAAVLRAFAPGTQVSSPDGGYVLWVALPDGSPSARTLFERARQEGIGIAPGHLFATDGRFDHCFRLNAGFGWNAQVREAIERLGELSVF
ncbi:MAG: PLP-dependent aminotransferase family protein [Acidovorax sp.]|uniref:aminotransferase-like domain-containing protein n=1 Tax=Acidovorax sp. TaxID=1872122 RepID=UPI0039E3B5AD